MDGVLNIAEGNQEFKEHNRRDTGSESSDGSTIPTISPEPEENSTNEYLTLNQEKMQYLIDDYIPPAKKSSHELSHTYTWYKQLADPSFVAAPVSTFIHAPMADGWDNIAVDMKVEVVNTDADPIPGVNNTAFWLASVLRISGYNVLLRYEGFGQDGSKDYWVNLCSETVHPVGWCATKGKPLVPPKTIQARHTDWKLFLVDKLTGSRTLPTNFYKVLCESVDSVFKVGMKLEVVDKMRISQVRVAMVVDITGRRLQLAYDDCDGVDGFWCHEESPLIHPVGWARKVGHQIAATPEYLDRCLMDTYLETDSTPDMFPEYRQPTGLFKSGQKVEAVDPLNLSTICVATVMKVLRHGYIMIHMDGYEPDPVGSDWFCYHGSSPFLFPPGFCDRNNIKLKVPAGYDGDFLWMNYLKSTRSEAAPMILFSHKDDCKHAFKAGMKMECTDLMDPRLVCVGTISRVVGRLLKVHFDGWEEDYDQWMDCESVDIYPVGWCEVVGHRLEAPRKQMPVKRERKRKQAQKKSVGKVGKKDAVDFPADEEETNPEASDHLKENIVGPEDTKSPIALDNPSVATPVEELEENKYIPRLLDAAGNVAPRTRDDLLEPAQWSAKNVSSFLEVNECSNLVASFVEKDVDGVRFLSLSKQEVMSLVSNKAGLCLKVEQLQKLLKDQSDLAHK